MGLSPLEPGERSTVPGGCRASWGRSAPSPFSPPRIRVPGATRAGGRGGGLGTVATLSFSPTKNLGAWGDAGLMVTQDDALAERLARLRLHGGSPQYLHEEGGTKSRVGSRQAAVFLG